MESEVEDLKKRVKKLEAETEKEEVVNKNIEKDKEK